LAASNSNADVVKALEDKNVSLAKEMFTRLSESQKNSLNGQLLNSRILFREDKTQESYDILEQLSEDNKDNADLYYYFGRSAIVMAQKASIFSKLSYASDALEAWERTLSLNPAHVKTLEGMIGFHIGAPSIAGGDIEQALHYSQTLLTLDPEKGYANLAKVYWQKEQDDLAEKAIADGLAILPNSGQLYFTQGVAYSRKAKDNNTFWGKARSALNKARVNAKSNKEKQHVLYQLGKVAVNSGEETQAGINALEELLTLKSEEYQQWGKYRLAELYFNDKQLTKANEFVTLINYQDDDDLEDKVKSLAKKIKKAVKKQGKVS
jgi:tetratricopeptide (TPR) repeat protein